MARVASVAGLAVLPALILLTAPSAGASDPWAKLRRPLRIPHIAPGSPCPVTPARRASTNFGLAQGPGPVYPVGGFPTLTFIYPPQPQQGWYGSRWSGQKVLWIARPKGLPIERSLQTAAPSGSAHRLPIPSNYAQTCRLVSSWCSWNGPQAGSIPAALRRPLQLPSLGMGGTCPTSSGSRIENGYFGGVALGPGPVRPLFMFGHPHDQLQHGIVAFRRYYGGGGWLSAKTLWFSDPSYRGPVFIRGRQIGGPRKIVMGEAPALIDPQLAPGPTLNTQNGWRTWPGGTYLRFSGCYAWQVDGTTFSYVVVFKAIRSRA